MGRSFSYEMLRGVRVAWLDCCGLSCLLPVCLHWLVVLKFSAKLFFVGRLVTRICWVAAQTSSSSMEYLFAFLNKSSIVIGGFLARDSKKGVPGQILILKICRTTSMLWDSTWSIACLNCFPSSLNDSFSCLFIFCRVLMFLFMPCWS